VRPQLYLFFKGDCLEAMTHYARTLGGTIEHVFFNKDAPSPEERMPGNDDLVMNLTLRLDDTLIMASDNSDVMYEKPQGFRIQLEMPSRAEFDRVFDALAMNAEGRHAARRDLLGGALLDVHRSLWLALDA
jgi:PhnB protein